MSTKLLALLFVGVWLGFAGALNNDTDLTPGQLTTVRKSWELLSTDQLDIVKEAISGLDEVPPSSDPEEILLKEWELNRRAHLTVMVLHRALVSAPNQSFILRASFQQADIENCVLLFLEAIKKRGASADDVDAWKAFFRFLVTRIVDQ